MGACCSLGPPQEAREGEAPGAAPVSFAAQLMSAAQTAAQSPVVIHALEQISSAGISPALRDAVDARVAELDDGANIPLSTCTGNKKSLFVGINYFGSKSELRGCINDVQSIKQFVTEKFNFPTDPDHMRVLTDDQKGDPSKMPTKANIMASMKWLVEGAKSGDSLFFHYSGHGGTQKDNGADEADGCDETLIPVDYETVGIILDDDIHAELVASLPEGVRLTGVMDCCHSGSIFDLPYTYGMNASNAVYEKDNRKAAIQAALAAGLLLVKGDSASAFAKGKEAFTLFTSAPPPAAAGQAPAPAAPPDGTTYSTHASSVKIKTTVADVIQFSGCRDEQTSADAQMGGKACGAMSWALIKSFNEKGMDQTYVDLLGNVRTNLQGRFQQVPQMSAGHRMNMGVKFLM